MQVLEDIQNDSCIVYLKKRKAKVRRKIRDCNTASLSDECLVRCVFVHV